MDYLPSFFIGVKKRIAALFIGTTIRFLSFYSILLFPENITSWPHSIFFFSDYNLCRNRCYDLVPDRTVCVRPPGADLSVSGLNRCSQPLQLISPVLAGSTLFQIPDVPPLPGYLPPVHRSSLPQSRMRSG